MTRSYKSLTVVEGVVVGVVYRELASMPLRDHMNHLPSEQELLLLLSPEMV